MTTRPRGLATFLLLTLLLCSISLGVAHTFKPISLPSDSVGSLDPNDCSRGIDEANQEACDVGGGQ